MPMITCPHCQQTKRQNKAGRTPSGSQRYRRMFGIRKYTPEPKSQGYPPGSAPTSAQNVCRWFELAAQLAPLAAIELPTDAIRDIVFDGHSLYAAGQGWQAWVVDGGEAGLAGSGAQLEAVKIILGEDLPEGMSLAVQGHVQDIGWLDGARLRMGNCGHHRGVSAVGGDSDIFGGSGALRMVSAKSPGEEGAPGDKGE